jgi:hypothetical protein
MSLNDELLGGRGHQREQLPIIKIHAFNREFRATIKLYEKIISAEPIECINGKQYLCINSSGGYYEPDGWSIYVDLVENFRIGR